MRSTSNRLRTSSNPIANRLTRRSSVRRSAIHLSAACLSVLLAGGHLSLAAADDGPPHRVRLESAVRRAVKARDSAGDQPSAADWVQLGDAQLRAGRVDAAIESFERAIELAPRSEPYLWQYGIALFFADRFDDGRRLFERHRKVNPNDVENAAWHFLCVAKSESLPEARRLVLPAPDDPRTPMREVLERLKGGDNAPIIQAMDEETVDQASARFYGRLYLGLIADAEGDRAAAKKHLRQAASTTATHYMADVARVYAEKIAPDR